MWGGLEAALAVAVCITMIVLLAACVCGCPKDTHKSELVGTAGVVKLRFEEEAPPPTQTTPLSAKRASAQNTQRSLPEIPPSVPRQDSGDTASELYATVGTNQRISEHNSPVATRRSDHPYEHAYARLQDGSLRVDEPTVANENVTSASGTLPLLGGSTEESQSSPEAIVITASVAINGQVSSSRELPYMTPPVAALAVPSLPAPSLTPPDAAVPALNPPPALGAPPQHFSGDSVDSAKGYTSISVREPLSAIRASLPNTRQVQPHYATVSDDSDEMYAAIEEPSNQVYTSGSETYAQIAPTQQVQATLHQPPAGPSSPLTTQNVMQHSAADSGSTAAVTHSLDGGETSSRRPTSETPSRQNLPKHSRQASNSSCSSSVGTLGSPKPEKRQANSPLPPPPGPTDTVPSTSTVSIVPTHKKGKDSPVHHHPKVSTAKPRISSTGDLHNNPDKLRRSLNEKHQRNNSCVSSSDFYGCNYPVDKHRFSSGDLARSLVAKELNFTLDKPATEKQADAIYNTIDGTNDIYAAIDQEVPHKSLTNQLIPPSSPSKNLEEMYAKVIKKSKHSQDRSQASSRLSNYDDLESGNIIKLRKKSLQHEEDRLSLSNETKRFSGTSPTSIPVPDSNYRNSPSPKNINLNKEDPGYETIDRIRNKNHSYETIDKNVAKHKSEKNIDPGYETVKDPIKKHDSQKRKTIHTSTGGSTQHSHNSLDILQRSSLHEMRNSIGIEPGYETVPSGPESMLSNDPGYEHILRTERCPSDSDPNYEVLRPHDSNSPYASIKNKSQVPGYSIINKKPKVPETDWMANNNENSNSEPNYESMPHDPLYNTGSESDPNYESVGPKDPNYESVKYFDVAMKEPPYEKVHNDSVFNDNSSGSQFQRTGSASGYERIKSILKHSEHEDQNDNKTNGVTVVNPSGEIAPVGDYFHV